MPIFDVNVSMSLSGIERVTFDRSTNWKLAVLCSNCKERSEIEFNAEDEVEIPGSRGHANIVFKCKLCERHHYLKIVGRDAFSYSKEDEGSFKTLGTFECRGVEVEKWIPYDAEDFTALCENSGNEMGFSLFESEYYDYDPVGEQEIAVTDVEHRLTKHK